MCSQCSSKVLRAWTARNARDIDMLLDRKSPGKQEDQADGVILPGIIEHEVLQQGKKWHSSKDWQVINSNYQCLFLNCDQCIKRS